MVRWLSAVEPRVYGFGGRRRYFWRPIPARVTTHSADYRFVTIAHAAPILASGVGVWGKDPHWWSTSMDTAIHADNPPPKWYGKPADRVVTVGDGLTIVSAAAGEKFLVLFSVASPQVNLE